MKVQNSTIYPSPTLCIKPQEILMIQSSSDIHWSSHGTNFIWCWALYGYWWQRGRNLDKDIKCLDKDIREMRVQAWTWHGSRGSNIEEDQHSWKRSTQVGGASSWTWLFAFDMCIFMCLLAFVCVHIHVLACICMCFKIYICNACVWCMLVIELDWWFDN